MLGRISTERTVTLNELITKLFISRYPKLELFHDAENLLKKLLFYKEQKLSRNEQQSQEKNYANWKKTQQTILNDTSIGLKERTCTLKFSISILQKNDHVSAKLCGENAFNVSKRPAIRICQKKYGQSKETKKKKIKTVTASCYPSLNALTEVEEPAEMGESLGTGAHRHRSILPPGVKYVPGPRVLRRILSNRS